MQGSRDGCAVSGKSSNFDVDWKDVYKAAEERKASPRECIKADRIEMA